MYCTKCAKLVKPEVGIECPDCGSTLFTQKPASDLKPKPKAPPVVEIPVVEPPVTGKVEPKKV